MQDQDKLTPDGVTAAERELEQALKSLRPAAARVDPLAAALAAGRRASQRRVRLWQSAAAAAIVGAGGLWLAPGSRGPGQHRVDEPTAAPVAVVQSAARHTVEPTFLTYHRALLQSPAALEALLDERVTTGVARNAEVMPVSVLTYWNSNLPSSLGEM